MSPVKPHATIPSLLHLLRSVMIFSFCSVDFILLLSPSLSPRTVTRMFVHSHFSKHMAAEWSSKQTSGLRQFSGKFVHGAIQFHSA